MAHGPVHLTHFYHRRSYPGGHEPMLALVEDARDDGQDVTFDTYPYEWASTRLLIQLPHWVQAGGPEPLLERLGDPGTRARLRTEMLGSASDASPGLRAADIRLGAFANPENVGWEGATLDEVCRETGRDPVDALCDLLVGEDLGINQVTPGPWSETLPHFVAHPAGMVGTDSTFIGQKPSPRTYGSYPRILGQFVRDEKRLSLPEAVRKMTSAPAARLGLRDRGQLQDGWVADVVVFDPARVQANATYDEPRRHSEGIEHVLVNGVAVVADGHPTGARPGRALRHRRD
jgi:N-acyl-D-amino-acid deacylase